MLEPFFVRILRHRAVERPAPWRSGRKGHRRAGSHTQRQLSAPQSFHVPMKTLDEHEKIGCKFSSLQAVSSWLCHHDSMII